ncbi:hypothetical protein HYT52_00370 [Candidatus Woesearchaeota archaeon]|nr:hypothetical protein [Candidatus Woesearchaeota archaeon]
MIQWELCNTRRLGVQGALAWNKGIGKYFKERYGTGIFNTLTYFDGKRTDYFFDQEQHHQFNEIIDANFSNREFVLSMISEAKETLEEKYEHLLLMVQNYTTFSSPHLAKLFEEISHRHGDFYPRKWMAYRICHRIDLQIEKRLINLGKSKEESAELLRILSVPLKPNYVVTERQDLLKIALKKENISEEELKQELDIHTQNYCHMPLFDVDHDPYTIEHFTDELKLVKNPQEELQKIEEGFRVRKQEFERRVLELGQYNELKDLLIMLKRAVFFRDYADTIRQKLNYRLREFYSFIGLKIGLHLGEIVLLTDEEIFSHLNSGKTFDSHELSRRKDAFLLQQLGENVLIISSGNVEGRVKIVYTNRDLDKIQPDDIMVTTMTRQDFVPYLRKIKALVTEEGGIACHAAIIARELGIPCIVGVENATRILEDNQIIVIRDGQISIPNFKNKNCHS